jgi:glutamate 5-kinase
LYGHTVAQVLLTRADLADRRRYLNARNTLTALIKHNILPIINENDTVATEEIRVGDNDNLSALVANVVEADLLALLTDQPGLFTADPRTDPTARLVEEVTEAEIPSAIWEAAGGNGTQLGTGGMLTKLQARTWRVVPGQSL